LKIPRRKQRGIFDPNGDESICIRASNPRPKGRGNATRVRVQYNKEETPGRRARGTGLTSMCVFDPALLIDDQRDVSSLHNSV